MVAEVEPVSEVRAGGEAEAGHGTEHRHHRPAGGVVAPGAAVVDVVEHPVAGRGVHGEPVECRTVVRRDDGEAVDALDPDRGTADDERDEDGRGEDSDDDRATSADATRHPIRRQTKACCEQHRQQSGDLVTSRSPFEYQGRTATAARPA